MTIIRFKNWQKNQPRKDIKKPWYFSFQNEFFLDSKLYELDPEEKLTLVYLLCEASRSNKNGEFFLSREHYRLHSRLEDRVLNRSLKKLQSLQIIEQPRVRGMYVSCEPSVQQNRIEENRREENRVIHVEQGFDPSALKELWNSNSGKLPKVKELSPGRINKANARIRDKPDEAYWTEVVFKIQESPFCNGDSMSKWRATFDWLIQPDTHIKVMEGKYDKIDGPNGGGGIDWDAVRKKVGA